MTTNQDNTNGEYGNSNSEIDTLLVRGKKIINKGELTKANMQNTHIYAKSFLNEGEIKPLHKPSTRI